LSRKNTKLALSIIYLQITVIIWTYILIPYLFRAFFNLLNEGTIPNIVLYFRFLVQTDCFLIGSILLIPSSILYLLSYDERKYLANIAFGLGLPAWLLILISFGLSSGSWCFIYMVFAAFAMVPIILFGIVLFSESKIIPKSNRSKLYYGRDLRKYEKETIKTSATTPKSRIISKSTYKYPKEPKTRLDQPNIQYSIPKSRVRPKKSVIDKKYKYCSQCGTRLYYSDKFCYHCGYPQWLI